MNRGYLKLYRKIQENDLWLCEKFSKGQAWVDLLMLANVKPSSFFKRGVEITVGRGQVGISEKGLADRWKWSRQKVRGFLAHLEHRGQIEHQKSNVTTLITIVNYDDYNEMDTKPSTKKTPERHQKDTSKEVKEVKKESLKHIVLPEWIDQGSWDAFIDMRIKIKARPTERAAEMLISKLSKLRSQGGNANEIIDQSTMNSWKGFFAVKENKQSKQTGSPSKKMKAVNALMGEYCHANSSSGLATEEDHLSSGTIDVTPSRLLSE